MLGFAPSNWLQIVVGGGIGTEDTLTALSFANPVIQPKFLLWRAEDNGIPGLSLSFGVTLPAGRGETEFWSQVGLRLLFDVLTGGRWGDPLGAPGLFKAPGS